MSASISGFTQAGHTRPRSLSSTNVTAQIAQTPQTAFSAGTETCGLFAFNITIPPYEVVYWSIIAAGASLWVPLKNAVAQSVPRQRAARVSLEKAVAKRQVLAIQTQPK
jgi:hypothetical protein